MRHFQQIIRSVQMAALCVASGAVMSVRPLAAQTLFEWPVMGADVARYKTLEECTSAIDRVKDSIQRSADIWVDTMPLRRDDVPKTFAAKMVQTAQRCVGQFDIQTIPIDTWQLMLDGLLAANRGLAADSLVNRRLALIVGTDSAATWTRGAVFDSVIGIYLREQPIRFSVIEQRAREWVTISEASALAQSRRLRDVFDSARVAGQPQLAIWSATQVDRVSLRAVNECGGNGICVGNARGRHQRALDLLAYSVLLDSLRSNTAAYATIRQANWVKAGKLRGIEPVAGKQAPMILGDFWYDLRQQTDTVPVLLTTPLQRPSPGVVSLVVSLKQACNFDTEGFTGGKLPGTGCLQEYAILRRLAVRFPKLSITIVSQTTGFFGILEPLAPTAEAAMYARWWLGYHRIPAVLAVTNTEFWRVENPDRRRQNEPTPNQMAYSQDFRWSFGRASFLLLDQQGIAVDGFIVMNKQIERELEEKIDVLMNR